jgi:hypothetical protein
MGTTSTLPEDYKQAERRWEEHMPGVYKLGVYKLGVHTPALPVGLALLVLV